jgi:hypothetical protein
MSELVERYEDMSPLGRLRLYKQDDGDMIVAIIPDPDCPSGHDSVEFCSCGSGGGQSPKTLQALYALMAAIEADNADRKQVRGE